MKNATRLIRPFALLFALVFAACATQVAHAATVTWSGAGSDMTWTNAGNWTGGLPSGNAVVFPAVAFPASTNTPGAINNIVSTNVTITALTYANTNGASLSCYDTTLLASNVTLTVTGALVVDGVFSAQNEFDTTAAMTGTNCTLIITNNTSTCYIGGSASQNVESANFTLADGTNLITAGTFNVGFSSGGNGKTSTLNLGNGTNVINANTIQIGISKAAGVIQFAGPNGGLTIRNTNGVSRVLQLVMGFGSSGSGNANGKLLLAGHPATVLLNTNIIGENGADTGTASQGTVTIDDGTYDVTTLLMGLIGSTGTGGSSGNSFTVGGNASTFASLVVNSPSGSGNGSFIISDSNGGSGGSHSSSSTLNIATNGTAAIYCNVTKLQAAENTATINLNGGTLILEAATNIIGTPTVPIDNLSLNGGTIQLSANGNATGADIYASAVSASTTYGPNIINISSVTNVIIPVTIHLINFENGSDPGLANFQLGSLPPGYNATLQDNINGANSYIDLLISPNITIYNLLWVGAVGSTLNSNWNFTTVDWLNITNASPLNYTNPDFVNFDDSASNSTVTLATNFSPGGLAFSNSVLSYTLQGAGSIRGSVGLIMDGTATVNLTESGGDNFSGGVTVNSGTVILDDAGSAISGVVSIATSSTLQIGNNDNYGNLPASVVSLNGLLVLDQTTASTEASAITGTGNLTLNGSGTVTLSNPANNYSGNTTLNAGTLALVGLGTISNSTSVTITGSTLDVSGITGFSLLNNLSLANATVVVTTTNNPYLQPPITVANGSLSMSGTQNTITVTALPNLAAYPSSLTLIQAPNGGISGFNMVLGPLSAGYAGYATNIGNNVVLILTSGLTNARPFVTWSGVDQLGSISTNWSDAQNWELPGVPSPTDNVAFNDTASQSSSALSSVGGGVSSLNPANINNTVDVNFTIPSLIFTNINNDYHNTYINDGLTLKITSAATNGNIFSVGGGLTDFGGSAKGNVSISGPNATLTVINTNAAVIVGYGSASVNSQQAVLDLSALGTFNATVNSLDVGGLSTASVGLSGILYLAQTNNITAIGGAAAETGQNELLSLLVGETGKNGTMESFLYLGQTNTFNINGVGIGIGKQTAEMQFNPALTSPSAVFRAGDGVSPVAVWALGDALAQTGASSQPAGTADFTGGTVNALVTTMYIGRTPPAAGAHPITGTLTFGAGSFVVNTIYDGYNAPGSTTDYGVGSVNVNGTGVLQVGTLNLAWASTNTEASPTTGALNITGGTVLAGTIAPDTNNLGQSSITLDGGILAVTNPIGSLAHPLTSLTLEGGTLQLNPNVNSTNIVATTVTISSPTVINIASIAASTGGTLSIPLIAYTGADPTTNSLTLGTIPAGFSGAALVDDGVSLISLTITTPASLVWAGALSSGSLDGNWNTSDQNWLNGASYVHYADPDFVRFDDTASNSTVTVAAPVSPDVFNVNNSVLNYVFNGSHAISGTAGLSKSGSASLTLADSGGDNFSGGIAVSGGAVVLDNAGSSIGGNVTIAGGSSLQLGNNDANGNLPGAVTDNGSLILNRSDITLNLGNAISGTGSVSQIGTNTVTLSGGNGSFAGKVIITNGVLNTTTSTGLGGAAATVIITNNGALDDNGISFNGAGAPAVIVSGSGFNGAGAIINGGAQQISAFSNVVVAANVTFGGSNRWDIRASSGTTASLSTYPPGTPYSITKVGNNSVSLVSVGTIDASLGNIFVQQGEFAVQNSTAQLGNPASNLVVSAGAFLEMFGATTPLNKVITFNGNGTSDSFKSDTDTAGQNVIIGPVTLNGNCLFDVSSGQFSTIDSVITGTGGLTKVTQGTLTLTNVNTYTGNTTINGGILAFTGSGSVASSNIVVAAGATLNASGRTNQTLTLLNGQTLSGFGSVTGLVVAASGSTIAPGSSASVGILSVSNNVTLAGTNTMKVSRVSAATNDILAVSGTLALGGTLNVTSLGGTYELGDTFRLYSATGTTGAFAVTNLPALGGGLGLSYGNGILTVVVGVNTNPTNITAVLTGNTLSLAWPADHTGWRLQVQTNSLANGLNPNPAAWSTVPGSTTVDSENITVDPNQGTVFYRLVYP